MARPTTTKPLASAGPDRRLGWAGRWGIVVARHRRFVLLAWLVLAVVCVAGYPALHSRLASPDFSVPHSESARVDDLMAQHFPQLGCEQDLVVFHAADRTADAAEFHAVVDLAMRSAAHTVGVTGTTSPYEGLAAQQISSDKHTAFGVVGINGDMAARARTAASLQAALAPTAGKGVSVQLTGYSPVENDLMNTETADLERAEAIGLPMAVIVLVLSLGALVAAIVPVTVAGAGIAVTVGALFGLTTFLAFDSLVLSVSVMVGTGAGIDYAMFVVSRFAEELARSGITDRRDQTGIERAVGLAMDTAGRTVMASGLIVMISLCSLAVVGLRMLDGIAVGVVTVVLSTLAAAFTLLPASLATLGPAINVGALPARFRPALVRSSSATGGWSRWAHTVMARPLVFAGVGVAVLLVAATPIAGIRYGVDMGLSSLVDHPSGQAADRIVHDFGPGLLAPVEIVATGAGDTPLRAEDLGAAEQFASALSNDGRVRMVLPQETDSRMFALVVPRVAFDSNAAADLVRHIRTQAGQSTLNATVLVGGTSASFVDVSHRIAARFPVVIALVLAASLVFLVITFRAIIPAVKAILMNLLATGAALGITIMVFQHGIGERLLDFHSTGFLQVYLPMLVFAVLFGLSMDYEVFLIRRMKEQWDRGHDNDSAVATGLEATARPITAAAAIMVVVFASFVSADVLELKQIGLALAAAIAIDAVLVRLVLVPAMMKLLGQWNWWLPRVHRH